jgi:hypothetical protein
VLAQAIVDEARRLGGKSFFYRTGHSLMTGCAGTSGRPAMK